MKSKPKKMVEVKGLKKDKAVKAMAGKLPTFKETTSKPVEFNTPKFLETPDDEKDPHYSSNIKAVAYFPEEKRLEVIFKAKDNPEYGRLYSFTQPKDTTQPMGVPPSIWNNITAIYETFGSVGSFIAREVVQKYVGVRLDKGSV